MKEWEQLWLAYEAQPEYKDRKYFIHVSTEAEGELADSALAEIKLAAESMFGFTPDTEVQTNAGMVLRINKALDLPPEGFEIHSDDNILIVTASDERGLLYGTFRVMLTAASGKRLAGLSLREAPENPLRMLNHWDNIDATIERGYAGESFFFRNGKITVTRRIRDYARLLASLGINASVINNVNVRYGAEWLITKRHYSELREVSEIFAQYGVKLYLSLDFAAPVTFGELESADPLDEEVARWWEGKMKEVFTEIPNFGGFLVKADSEGRPGPFTYGRNHMDGANMLARAVKPYGGTIIWRCFVYNCQQDWRDLKTDRACSGYECFKPLDGKFEDNVILQVKNGPMDFQVREPVHPLFGKLQATNQILEVQAAQEYTGQQRDVCYLVPMWKEVLDFSTGCGKKEDTVADIISGRTFGQSACGIAAVSNMGDDENWTGHDLAGANLFGFGRLAWNPALSAEEIANDWCRLQISRNQEVVDAVCRILMNSWPVYEKYTAPLGIGFMVNPSYHYGPNPEGYEYSRWGTYHRADHLAIGVDRTEKGTGYTELYHEKNAAVFRNTETCPENLLLFFHRLPYTHRLHSGKTLIQHVYDTHYEGAGEVLELAGMWERLEGKVRPELFERVKARFAMQIENCMEWRDVINSFFYRKTLIPDEQGRPLY